MSGCNGHERKINNIRNGFRLNFGLIAVTMFVSMWISNTAAVAMMIPIMQAVLEELEAVSSLFAHFFRIQNIELLYSILFYFISFHLN